MTGKIPVRAAKTIAHQYGLHQCLLIGFDGEMVHVVTYGRTEEDCKAAAAAQDFWTGRIREFSFKGQPSEASVLDRIDKFISAVAPSKLTKELDSIRNEIRAARGSTK